MENEKFKEWDGRKLNGKFTFRIFYGENIGKEKLKEKAIDNFIRVGDMINPERDRVRMFILFLLGIIGGILGNLLVLSISINNKGFIVLSLFFLIIIIICGIYQFFKLIRGVNNLWDILKKRQEELKEKGVKILVYKD